MKKAFTLIEMVVAIGILAIMVSFAGTVFNVSIESYRVATANTEIMQKLRAITDQLNADFAGLRKDGEIFVVWSAVPIDRLIDYEAYADDPDGHVRFDRIMFFANGDFHTYHQQHGDVRSNVARVSYMLANRPLGEPNRAPQWHPRYERVLARTQHILTADTAVPAFVEPNQLDEQWLYTWHDVNETDRITMQQWMNMPWDDAKIVALSTIAGIDVGERGTEGCGAVVDTRGPDPLVHNILCEGVGEFMVQGWSDQVQRWVPMVDPQHDGTLTDFITNPPGGGVIDIDYIHIPGVLYPFRQHGESFVGGVSLGGVFAQGQPYEFPPDRLNEEHFNEIPGLGRALRFTFTLYDSRAIITEGRTFSHIVYLDE